MRIVDKKKFKARILELIVIVVTIILTIVAINTANKIRGHQAYGGEYLVPVFGLLIVTIIEDTYQSSKKGDNK